MALTSDIIKQNEALKELTPEQLTAIETLSANDENAVIAKKVGEIHGQYDEDIKAVTGMEKPSGIKTYEWLKKDVLPSVKIGIEAQNTIKSLNKKITGLEKQVKDGAGDEVVKQELKDAKKRMSDLQVKYDTDTAALKASIEKANKDQLQLRIGNEFDKALTGIAFKDVKIIPETVRESFISTAKTAILNENKPDFIDNGKGGKRLVFRNEAGDILNNPENKLEPFTAKELLLSKIKDIVDTGKKTPGGGSTPPGGGGADATMDLSGAKTQVEADEVISDYLLKKGLTRGSAEFAAEQAKIRKENKVNSLPIT